jgi:hypothetical protein
MKLRDARLCADCDEVYEATGLYSRCPACASEAFTLVSRYVPTLAEFEMWVDERSRIAGGLRRMEEEVIGMGGDVAASSALTPMGKECYKHE